MCCSVGLGSLMGAAGTQGTPAAFAVGAPTENTVCQMIHAFIPCPHGTALQTLCELCLRLQIHKGTLWNDKASVSFRSSSITHTDLGIYCHAAVLEPNPTPCVTLTMCQKHHLYFQITLCCRCKVLDHNCGRWSLVMFSFVTSAR